ncbi:MAG: nucleotidyltransferase family protein, partial [Ruminiclostridium sp.]|nr:nucleotidyltransferase family protein [Ruminiclostridium sp.]
KFMKTANPEAAVYLLALLKTVLNGGEPPEKPEGIDFAEVYRLARFHDVANTAFYAIEKLKNPPIEALLKEWGEVRDGAIVKHLIQQEEFAEIC